MTEKKVFSISANGFSMTDDKVSIPACRVKATSYFEAVEKLQHFLDTYPLTKTQSEDIVLITDIEAIDFPKTE